MKPHMSLNVSLALTLKIYVESCLMFSILLPVISQVVEIHEPVVYIFYYFAGALAGTVAVHGVCTLCRKHLIPAACRLTFNTYTLDCMETIRSRSVRITHTTHRPTQMTICEVGVKTKDE